MTIQLNSPARHELIVSPDIARLHQNFFKSCANTDNPVLSPVVSKNNKKAKTSSEKFFDFAFWTGITAAALQIVSGVSFMVLSQMEGGKERLENAALYKGRAALPAKIAFTTLGISYAICAPSTTGAGINSQQPGIVLHSAIAGILGTGIGLLSLIGKGGVGTRTKGWLSLMYAPLFAGFANKIGNDFYSEDNKHNRKMNIEFMTEGKTYENLFATNDKGKELRKKFWDSFVFSLEDMKLAFSSISQTAVKAFNQTRDYLAGKRKEKPEIASIKPSRESMWLGSSLIVLGSLPKVLFGNRLGTGGKWSKLGWAADIIIGAGFVFDTLGMMSVANANNDSRKIPMMIGGPMRMIGDFRQEENLFYGLRTFGGAAIEYYYALMNKEKDGKLA